MYEKQWPGGSGQIAITAATHNEMIAVTVHYEDKLYTPARGAMVLWDIWQNKPTPTTKWHPSLFAKIICYECFVLRAMGYMAEQ